MSEMKPNFGRILVKRCEPETKSGGIIIPETAQEKSSKGIVLAIGEFKQDDRFDIKIGDYVYFPKWGGTEIKDSSNEDVIIIKADEILAVERSDNGKNNYFG